MKGAESHEPRTKNQTFGLGLRHPVILSPCHLVTLVIGYGNDLRGDDAVGPLAATVVAAWDMPGVQVLAVHQLMPELAETLVAADLAIFVDARVPAPLSSDPVSRQRGPGQDAPPFPRQDRGPGSAGEEIVEARPIEPAAVDSVIGHTGDPRALLALTKALYGRCPVAWSITVPARNFAFGAGLSPAAQRGLTAALQQISDLLANAAYATNQPQEPKGHKVIDGGASSACVVARESNNRG
jgi:hydrogenase maturation protease